MPIVRSGSSSSLAHLLTGTSEREISLEPGNYSMPYGTFLTLISRVDGRKITGIVNPANAGAKARLIFTDVPNNSVCLDFRDRVKIRNIQFEVRPSSSSPSGIIIARFRRQTPVTFQLIATVSNSSSLPRSAINHSSGFFTWNNIRYTYGALAPDGKTIRYYFRRLKGGVNPPAYEIWVFDRIEENLYGFVKDMAGDEADLDFSCEDCLFTSFVTGATTAIESAGRGFCIRDNQFFNLDTAIRLSFPRTSALSFPGSLENPEQSGFYGYKKGEVQRCSFIDTSRCLHLTGDVTIRGLLLNNNTATRGQFLFCDGNGGMRSSIISNNAVGLHNEKSKVDYNSTILFKAGHFDDNLISNNTFSGDPNSIIFAGSGTLSIRGNLITNNSFSNATTPIFLDKFADNQSVTITQNTFRTSAHNVITLGLKQNENVSGNTVINTSASPSNSFVNLIGGTHSRLIVVRNTFSNYRAISETSLYSLQTSAIQPFT